MEQRLVEWVGDRLDRVARDLVVEPRKLRPVPSLLQLALVPLDAWDWGQAPALADELQRRLPAVSRQEHEPCDEPESHERRRDRERESRRSTDTGSDGAEHHD